MKPEHFARLAHDLQAKITGTMESWIAGEPVWSYGRILDTWGASFENYRLRWSKPFHREDMDTTMAMMEGRHTYIHRFGFVVPCAELIEALAESKSYVLEVGAGSGYMTRLMRNAGIVARGTDPALEQFGFNIGQYYPIEKMQAKTAVRHYWGADTIFCSWPSLKHTWFRQMLKAMPIGQRLIVIHESACADETAWDYFDSSFDVINNIHIPCWYGLHDSAMVAVKKRHGTHGVFEPPKPWNEIMDNLKKGAETIRDAVKDNPDATEAEQRLGDGMNAALESYDEVRARNGYQQKLAYLKGDNDVEDNSND